MANTHYRLATGHISKATIQGSSSYLLSNFATQSDQPANLKWSIAHYVKVRDYVERLASLTTYTTSGLPNFVLVFSGLTPKMYDYLIDTFLPGVESKEATVQIPDKRYAAADQLVVYQGMLHRPEPEEYNPKPGRPIPIALEVPFMFTNGVLQA